MFFDAADWTLALAFASPPLLSMLDCILEAAFGVILFVTLSPPGFSSGFGLGKS